MEKFHELVTIVEKLRHPETGCPWDRKQTSRSLIPNFVEEVYEAIEAIENDDDTLLAEELGDILLHVILQIKIAEQKHSFTLDTVLANLNSKLKRRHPHIFNPSETHHQFENKKKSEDLAEQVKKNWEKIKFLEKKAERYSVLEGVPSNLPALIQAQRIQEKAASVGFDWDNIEPVIEKIYEEINEVIIEIKKYEKNNKAEIEMEMGDLFFAVVNLSRKLNLDAETALRCSIQKFKKRFQKVEKHCREQNIEMIDQNIETLDEFWEIAKKN